MRKLHRSLSFLALSPLLSLGLAVAQTGTGNIEGTIKDSSGAVLPGATVVLTHKQTSLSHHTTANGSGFYIFPSVQIGAYHIEASSARMETWKGDLTLQTGQTAVVDPVMKVAGTTDVIVVASDVTPLITTTSATLANVVERARIEQLPLNTRMILNTIANTTPGVEVQAGNYVQAYGMRYATEFLQDGALVENRDSGFTSNRPPGIDTIEEVRVETNNSAAKLSRPATIITSTKAGTNRIHGSAFETARNNGFGIARARTDYYLSPPQLVRNEFGVSLGGPVYVPKVYNGKNKTFFFFGYEALRLRQATTRSITMPTAAMRQGDYSGLIDGSGRAYTLYDPLTTTAAWSRVPFTNNQIPVSRQSPLSKYVNNITPLPTLTTNPMLGANWYGTGFNNQDNYIATTRVDQRIGERDQFFVRYSHTPNTQHITNSPSGSPTSLDGKANGYISETQNDNGVVTWTHTFSPTFFSETVATFSRDYWGQIPIAGLEDISSKLGLPNPFKGGGFPWVQSVGFGMDYYPGVNYTLNYAKVAVFDENLTKIHGRHEFQFGGRYRQEWLDTLADQQQVQAYSAFASGATSLYDPTSGSQYAATRYTGSDSANLFLGVASQYSTSFQKSWFNLRAREIAGYFQDNFKVTSRLTLNLGVRYEYNSPPTEANDILVGFDQKTKAVVIPSSTDALIKGGGSLPSIVNAYSKLGVKFESQQQAGFPTSFVDKNLWDFGPRVGFAYRLAGSSRPTSIRGGYAIYAYPEPLRMWNVRMKSSIPLAASFSQNWNAADQSPDGLPNYFLRNTPTIYAGANSSNVIDINSPRGIARGSGTVEYLNPDQKTARAHEWNFTIEREIMANTSARIGYVGTHATRMNQFTSLNDAPGAYIWYKTTGTALPTGDYASVATRPLENTAIGTISELSKTGWSNSQTFQAELQRRFSKGVGFQVFYVMANAMRAGGNGWRDDFIAPTTSFLPGAVPTDLDERNRFLNYRRNTDVPKHRFNYNWLIDLPIGKGKKYANHMNRVLDRIVGGWQLAGSGEIKSNWWTLPTSNWITGKVEVYGKKYKIQDCRTGTCYPGYLYWNGYIPANRINSYDANGKPNGVMGVPADYVPSNQPLIPMPKNGGSPSDPNYAYYDTNYVMVPMQNGTSQRVVFNDNLNPWRNQYMLGPMSFGLNASLFKVVRIKEGAFLRMNADFFNVMNLAGTPQPGSDGVIQMRNSAYTPRQLQLTMRLTW